MLISFLFDAFLESSQGKILVITKSNNTTKFQNSRENFPVILLKIGSEHFSKLKTT